PARGTKVQIQRRARSGGLFPTGTGDAMTVAVLEDDAQWIARWLSRSDLDTVDPADLSALAPLFRRAQFPAGTTIFRSGDAATRIGIVRWGAIAACRELNGRRVVLQILRSGEAVGDIGVFLRMTAPCDGVALEDTLLLTADSVAFHRL